MIANLEELKDFLKWCRELGIVAVKFSEERANGITLTPADVVFSGVLPDAKEMAFGGPVKHEEYKDDEPVTVDGIVNEEGEAVTDADLFPGE